MLTHYKTYTEYYGAPNYSTMSPLCKGRCQQRRQRGCAPKLSSHLFKGIWQVVPEGLVGKRQCLFSEIRLTADEIQLRLYEICLRHMKCAVARYRRSGVIIEVRLHRTINPPCEQVRFSTLRKGGVGHK